MANKSKQKGNRFEYECVKVLKDMGYEDVERAYGSNGLSLPGCKEDVDILADGTKIQCKVRSSEKGSSGYSRMLQLEKLQRNYGRGRSS